MGHIVPAVFIRTQVVHTILECTYIYTRAHTIAHLQPSDINDDDYHTFSLNVLVLFDWQFILCFYFFFDQILSYTHTCKPYIYVRASMLSLWASHSNVIEKHMIWVQYTLYIYKHTHTYTHTLVMAQQISRDATSLYQLIFFFLLYRRRWCCFCCCHRHGHCSLIFGRSFLQHSFISLSLSLLALLHKIICMTHFEILTLYVYKHKGIYLLNYLLLMLKWILGKFLSLSFVSFHGWHRMF